MRVYRSDRNAPTSIVQLKPTTFTVNEVLQSDAFDFRFPENAQVIAEEKGKPIVYLWGPDNKSVLTITKIDELFEAQRQFDAGYRPGTSRAGYVVWTIVSIGALLAVLALKLRRRRGSS